ncbi:hypothetical protein ABK040_003929 [Willaertia magna]
MSEIDQPITTIVEEKQDEEEITEYYNNTLINSKRTFYRNLWAILGGGWFFSFLYGLFAFVWFGCCCCLCLPCSFQLFRIFRFVINPFHFQEFTIRNQSHKGKERQGVIVNNDMLIMKKLLYKREKNTCSLIFVNILWLFSFGWIVCFCHLLSALFLTLTVIGFSFAKRHLVLIPISLMPFGVFIRFI